MSNALFKKRAAWIELNNLNKARKVYYVIFLKHVSLTKRSECSALVKMADLPKYRNFVAGQSQLRKWEYCFLIG